jgi:uncharacterized protein (DUF2235 family)
MAADASPSTARDDRRNLIVCLDGTNNEFGIANTNVVRLFQSLATGDGGQLAYYDPGVGTIWEPGTLWKTSQRIQMVLGLAFGLGVSRNVAEAYGFLMRHHRAGDRIAIFGFSRGALEARALAGLLHRCGLLQAHLSSLEPYALRLAQTVGGWDVANEFKATFSRAVKIAFLGLWDTVTSMGNVWSPIHWPYTSANSSVESVAHAIAIDERRAFFRQNRWKPSAHQTFDEVWFSGVHSDVGGGYPASSGRLWAITLRWMVDRAGKAELKFDGDRLEAALGEGRQSPGVPDSLTGQNNSLTTAWKPLECVPKLRRQRRADGTYGPKRIMVPGLYAGVSGRPRELFPGERVHRSAIERFMGRSDYRPPSLLKAGLDEDLARRFLATEDEYWTVPPPPGAQQAAATTENTGG